MLKRKTLPKPPPWKRDKSKKESCSTDFIWLMFGSHSEKDD